MILEKSIEQFFQQKSIDWSFFKNWKRDPYSIRLTLTDPAQKQNWKTREQTVVAKLSSTRNLEF